MTKDIWTIGRLLKWTEQYFGEKGVESARLDAEVLLSHVLGKARIYLYVHFDEPLQAGELAVYRELIKRRVRREPVAYIVGHREFMGLDFKVTKDTLVPRPDTEVLVQAAVEGLRAWEEQAGAAPAFADIGTGSGAICLAALHLLPGSRAVTVDISPAARQVAEENAAKLGLSERVEFLTGDLLEPLAGRRFAAVLSNPPYIPQSDLAGLAPEVRDYEPRGALDGGADGLDFYRRLAADGPELLQPGGFLAFEVGIRQARAVEALLKEHPRIGRTEVRKDYAGIERVVMAWREE